MKPIERGEVLGLAEYEKIREQFRARVIGAKKARRVQVGPKVSVVFENRDTVLMQIQEMLRTERITREGAIQHEIDTYNQHIPGKDELFATVMIEVPDRDEREAFLAKARGFERHVALVVDGERVDSDVAPVTTGNAKAFVPLRSIADALGAETEIDPKTGKISIP